MRIPGALLLLVPVALAAVPQGDAVPAERPPHIVLVMVDDLGWRDAGPASWAALPGEGHDALEGTSARHFRTPHLDALAAGGVRFAEAYASAPVCTPTRTSLMTGASPARNRITYWTRHADRDTSARHPFLRAPRWNVNGLQPGDVTLPGLLRGAGYRTIHVGKAHLGTGQGGDPTGLGFDVNVAGWSAGAPGSYYGIDDFSGAGRARREGRGGGGHGWDVPGLEDHHGEDVFLTDVLAAAAAREFERAVAADERAFLHFAPYGVHTPIMAHPGLVERFPDLAGPELAYATMVAAVDDALGLILETIDELGIAGETLVVFTSDNGGLSAHGRGGPARHTHNAPLRSGKGSAYEGGTRVPLIVRWPGVTGAGRVVRGPAITHDLFPTLLAAAGASAPDDHAARVEGIDLRPILAGSDAPVRPLFWHQPHFWGVNGPGIEPFSAVRLGRHKLIWFHSTPAATEGEGPINAGPRFELYDLHADPGEARDLADERPATRDALAQVLRNWLDATDAQLSIDAGSGRPVTLAR